MACLVSRSIKKKGFLGLVLSIFCQANSRNYFFFSVWFLFEQVISRILLPLDGARLTLACWKFLFSIKLLARRQMCVSQLSVVHGWPGALSPTVLLLPMLNCAEHSLKYVLLLVLMQYQHVVMYSFSLCRRYSCTFWLVQTPLALFFQRKMDDISYSSYLV